MRGRTITTIFSILMMGAAACASHPTGESAPPKPTATVQVRALAEGGDAATFQTVGRVKNVKESVLASKVMGMVKQVRVKAGDAVKKGDLLLRIDDREVAGGVQQARGAVSQAEAAVSIAEANLKRFEELAKKGSASPAELDKARFDYQSASGALNTARGALATAGSMAAEASVTAPFDGRVVDTMIEQGEMVAPGRPLLKVEGESELEFETTVDERDVRDLREGQSVNVALDISRDEHQDVAGTITEIVPASDIGTHTNIVRIRLADQEGVRSGTFGRARFPRSDERSAVLSIPADRLVRQGQLTGVYIVDEVNTLRLRLVREGRESGGDVEILSGLNAGDRLVVSDIANLIDGQSAQVTE